MVLSGFHVNFSLTLDSQVTLGERWDGGGGARSGGGGWVAGLYGYQNSE